MEMEQVFIDLDADRILFSVGVYHPAEICRFRGLITKSHWEVDTLEINGVDILGLEIINFELIEEMIVKHIESEAKQHNQDLREAYA